MQQKCMINETALHSGSTVNKEMAAEDSTYKKTLHKMISKRVSNPLPMMSLRGSPDALPGTQPLLPFSRLDRRYHLVAFPPLQISVQGLLSTVCSAVDEWLTGAVLSSTVADSLLSWNSCGQLNFMIVGVARR